MIATTPQDSSHTACQPTGDGHCTLADRGFHLIGIGGAGMSVVAQLLTARGARSPDLMPMAVPPSTI